MNEHNQALTNVRPAATVAVILGRPEPAPPAPSATRVFHDGSKKIREEIRRRHETPFKLAWQHGGINE